MRGGSMLDYLSNNAAACLAALGISGGGTAATYRSLGTGDGSARAFDLPSSSSVVQLAVVDGIVQSPSTWSVSSGTGADGVNQLVFGVGNTPSNGASIEALIST